MNLRVSTLVALFALTGLGFAEAGPIVPGGFLNVEADGNNGFPFNIAGCGPAFPTGCQLETQRYQQAYAGSEFSGPLWIEALRFRPDSVLGGAFAATTLDLTIVISTTTRGMDVLGANPLSPTFADNTG